MSKEKFDAKKEAVKMYLEEQDRLSKMPQIKTEHTKRSGTRVCVNFKDGSKRIFYHAEGGIFAGWNEE